MNHELLLNTSFLTREEYFYIHGEVEKSVFNVYGLLGA